MTERKLSPDDEQTLRIAKSCGLVARRGPTPGDDELRRAVAALEAVIADAMHIINLRAPEVACDEFGRRARNLREYARDLLARMP